MPNIKPISELRNYTEVLREVDQERRVYLTRNGHGAYTIMTIEESDEYDKLKAAYKLLTGLKRAEAQADHDGWLSVEEVEKELGVDR